MAELLWSAALLDAGAWALFTSEAELLELLAAFASGVVEAEGAVALWSGLLPVELVAAFWSGVVEAAPVLPCVLEAALWSGVVLGAACAD